MSPTRRTVLGGIGAAGVLTLGGVAPAVARDDDGGEAALRVAHASPDAPNVDVYVDGSKVLSDVPFRAVSDYLEVPADSYRVTVTAAGDPDAVVFDGELTLDSEDYTVAAIGELSEGTFRPLVLEDNNGVVFGDSARVRLVHASPDAPAVDVTVAGTDITLFDGVAFRESGGYVEVPAGDYTLEVRPATEDDDGPVVASFDVSLESGDVYTAFAEGYLSPGDEPAGEPFGLVVSLDRSAPPRGDGEEDAEEDDTDEGDEESERRAGRVRGD
ncbi:MAG: DUF4397 domain-containing protein [Halobacteriaceae archaeon]